MSKTFNFDPEEIAADPIHMMYVLKNRIAEEEFNDEKETMLLDMLDGVLSDKYMEDLEKDIRASFLDSFSELCQNVFESYFYYAEAWIDDTDYRDPTSDTVLDREAVNKELEGIEKPAGIASPKEFRQEITRFVMKHRGNNKGNLPRWDEFEKMRVVIEKKVLASTDEILPVISFSPKRSEEEQKKHNQFVTKMTERGYTTRQTRFLCDWFMRTRKTT
jgi:serine protein kinase